MAKKKNTTRKDGRIAVQVYLGRDGDGKRMYKTVYGVTQKEADEKALQVKIAMRKGIDVMAERDTFGEWAERWKKVKEQEVSRSRYLCLCSTSKHLTEALGEMTISKIRPADIQGVVADLAARNPHTGRPTAPNTLQLVRVIVNQIFQLAVENRVIDYNPANAVRIPPITPVWERRALTDEERAWVEETPHRARCAAMVMMYAGLRRGELIPLLWSDIDLKARTISVNKSVEHIGARFVVKGSLKTEASRRVVDIPNKLVAFLAAQPRRSLYVCPRSSGDIHSFSSWQIMWESYLVELNFRHGDHSLFRKQMGKKVDKLKPKDYPMVIPNITAHWLRHTFATNLYLAGVDIMAAKEQLGHSSINTTLQIYTHLDAQHKRRSMDKLDAFLDGCKSDASQDTSKSQ